MADYRSLFIDPPPRQWVSGPGASGEWRIEPSSFLDDEQDNRFPAFQDAWKRGTGLADLFGPNPFSLHGTVAPSGGDNHRADVAKVQTFLGKAGYLDLGSDGPSGYPTDRTDEAVRRFQKDKGLTVDGILKPGGPTITALGGLLGGGSTPAPKPETKGLFGEFNDSPAKPAGIMPGEWDWEEEMRKRMPSGPGTPPITPWPGGKLGDVMSDPWPRPIPNPPPPLGEPEGEDAPTAPFPGQPTPPPASDHPPGAPSSFVEHRPTPQQIAQYEAEYRKWVEENWATIQRNEQLKKMGLPPLPLPEPPRDPRVKDPYIMYARPNTAADNAPNAVDKPFAFDAAGRVRSWMEEMKQKRDQDWSRVMNPSNNFANHTISADGAREHDAYAANLVRDTNPDETARYLKNVLAWHGDQGRGDVADLLGRFAKVDAAKARTLQDALHRATGERVPFRVAPMGKGFVEQESVGDPDRLPERNPFGSGAGTDPWEAANMADALAKKSSYEGGPLDYFKGEFAKDRTGALAYTAAVYDALAQKNPEQAALFHKTMATEGLVASSAANNGAPEGAIRGSGTKDDPWVSEAGTKVWKDADGWHLGDISPSGTQDGPDISVAPPPGSAPPKFDPRYGDDKTPPEWKKDVLNGQPGAWEAFNKSLGNLPGVTDTEKFIFGQIFAAEGGNRVDPRSDASSGVLPSTLEAAKASGKVPGLDKVKSPKDMSADQRAAVMKWYFDGALGKVGGGKMLDGLNDKAAANAMADVLYRFGGAGGGAALRQAINEVGGAGMVDKKGSMDARTFEAYRQLIDDPKTRDRLLNAIAEHFDRVGERERANQHRPRK